MLKCTCFIHIQALKCTCTPKKKYLLLFIAGNCVSILNKRYFFLGSNDLFIVIADCSITINKLLLNELFIHLKLEALSTLILP